LLKGLLFRRSPFFVLLPGWFIGEQDHESSFAAVQMKRNSISNASEKFSVL
jgi:hypothetical protein